MLTCGRRRAGLFIGHASFVINDKKLIRKKCVAISRTLARFWSRGGCCRDGETCVGDKGLEDLVLDNVNDMDIIVSASDDDVGVVTGGTIISGG